MRLLRKGPEFTDSRIRFYLSASIGLFSLAVLVFGVTRNFRLQSIGFFGIVTLLIWFKVSFRAWER